jgi:hypothetical protein
MYVIIWLKLDVMKIGLHIPYTIFWTLYAGIYNHLSSEKSEKSYNIRPSRFLIINQPWRCDNSTIKFYELRRSRNMYAEFANILRLPILQNLVAHYQHVKPTP